MWQLENRGGERISLRRRLAFVKTQLLLFKSRKARPAERKSKVSGVLGFPTQRLWTRARVGEGPRSRGRKKNSSTLPLHATGLILAASWGSSLQPPWGSTLQPPWGSSLQPPWCAQQGPWLQWGAQGWRAAPKVLNQHKVAQGNAPCPLAAPQPLFWGCAPLSSSAAGRGRPAGRNGEGAAGFVTLLLEAVFIPLVKRQMKSLRPKLVLSSSIRLFTL